MRVGMSLVLWRFSRATLMTDSRENIRQFFLKDGCVFIYSS